MDEVRLIEVKEGVFSENEKIADQVYVLTWSEKGCCY